MQCKAHTSANDPVSLGNEAAKTAHQNQNQNTVLIPKKKIVFVFRYSVQSKIEIQHEWKQVLR